MPAAQPQPPVPNGRIRMQKLQVIFVALLVLQILVLVSGVYLGIIDYQPGRTQQLGEFGPQADTLVLVVCALAVGVVVSLANGLYYMRTRQGRRLHTLHAKLFHYQSSTIMRLAMLEGGNVFVSVFIMLTGNKLLLGLSALTLGIYLLSRPTLGRFGRAYHIVPRELEALEANG